MRKNNIIRFLAVFMVLTKLLGSVPVFAAGEELMIGSVEELRELEDPCISLQADKSVPLEQIVKVMNIAKDHNYRLIIATTPE